MGELVEMATIDKEMAEEKAELLQNDVTDLYLLRSSFISRSPHSIFRWTT